jgi:DNA polymerase-4
VSPAERSILHVDMDAFFAAIEVLDNPSLRGKPMLVGSDDLRGVVATASYEARVYGCHSAQPMAVAKRNCPQAIVVPCRFHRYRELSDRIFTIFEEFSPSVQPLSIDEAFLDLTGTEQLQGPAERVARVIKERIRSDTGLTASIGVAPNKFLAKLASDLNKPDGLTVIRTEDVDRVLPPLPVTKIWGIGPKTARRLDGMCIRTIADLRRASDETLTRFFGEDAERVRRLAHGQDERPVETDDQAKQISQENTFRIDVQDRDVVLNELLEQVQQVARRLRKHGLRAGGVTLKIRFGEFKTITRSRALDEPTDRTNVLWQTTCDVFGEWADTSFQPVRLIGMAARSLSRGSGGQLSLFADPKDEKQQRLDRAVDAIAARFGSDAVRRGVTPAPKQQ